MEENRANRVLGRFMGLKAYIKKHATKHPSDGTRDLDEVIAALSKHAAHPTPEGEAYAKTVEDGLDMALEYIKRRGAAH